MWVSFLHGLNVNDVWGSVVRKTPQIEIGATIKGVWERDTCSGMGRTRYQASLRWMDNFCCGLLGTGKYVAVLAGMGDGITGGWGLINCWGGITDGGLTSAIRGGGTLCGEWAIGTCVWCGMFPWGGFCCCGLWGIAMCNWPGTLELFGPKNWFTCGFVEKSGTKMPGRLQRWLKWLKCNILYVDWYLVHLTTAWWTMCLLDSLITEWLLQLSLEVFLKQRFLLSNRKRNSWPCVLRKHFKVIQFFGNNNCVFWRITRGSILNRRVSGCWTRTRKI